jgi:hypothetical protein
MNTTQPLRNGWRIDERTEFVKDEIAERVRSEDVYTWAKGYPLIKVEDVKGKAGKPIWTTINKKN